MSHGRMRSIELTPKGRRYASLLRLSDEALHTLGATYADLGLIERRPEYLYSRSAVVAAIVAADFDRLRLIKGEAA